MATGQLTYNFPGRYSFVCPPDVTSVSVVCVGAGGKSSSSKGTDAVGGGGGGLGYKNNITVIPGNTYNVVVGEGGRFWGLYNKKTDGGDSYFISKETVSGLGGAGGIYGTPGVGGTYIGDGGGNGGAGGAANSLQGGGGGAGGYSGNGGDGLSSASGSSGAGSGGAGGGGYQAGGGGVGIMGEGSSGAAVSSGNSGKAGSVDTLQGLCGADAQVPNQTFPYVNSAGVSTSVTYKKPYRNGGSYGGGGGGCLLGGGGADGAVRIIWGDGRAFPSTNTGDVGLGVVGVTSTYNVFDWNYECPHQLYLLIKNESVYQHPVLKANIDVIYKLSETSTDTNDNFNRPENYIPLWRDGRPELGVYQKNQTSQYRSDKEFINLGISSFITPIECPVDTYVEGLTSGAIGYAVTGAHGNEIELQNTKGQFWVNETIKLNTRDNNIFTRITTSVGIGTTVLDRDIGSWRVNESGELDMDVLDGDSSDVLSNIKDGKEGYGHSHISRYEEVWWHEEMTDDEKTLKQNLVKDEWSVGLGTMLTSWVFNEHTCEYEPPLSVPSPGVVGVVTNISLYDNTGANIGSGSSSLPEKMGVISPFVEYRWDEAAYQADNTKGWVAD